MQGLESGGEASGRTPEGHSRAGAVGRRRVSSSSREVEIPSFSKNQLHILVPPPPPSDCHWGMGELGAGQQGQWREFRVRGPDRGRAAARSSAPARGPPGTARVQPCRSAPAPAARPPHPKEKSDRRRARDAGSQSSGFCFWLLRHRKDAPRVTSPEKCKLKQQ